MTLSPFPLVEVKARTIRKTFYRETSVQIEIDANAATIWTLLKAASDYPGWNSTVTWMEGDIAPGGKIRLKSSLDKNRIFRLKILEFEPERRLVWGDRQGKRVFEIETLETTEVRVRMTERIGGLLFPLYGRFIPPFDESFEQFVRDLKNEAERISYGQIN